jgi:hypothetical protein
MGRGFSLARIGLLAAVAQLVEQLPRKEQVWGSIPHGGSKEEG